MDPSLVLIMLETRETRGRFSRPICYSSEDLNPAIIHLGDRTSQDSPYSWSEGNEILSNQIFVSVVIYFHPR